MSMKLELVERAEKGESVSALCREFGVSRTTGHKWLKRFREEGYDGLPERSRRPKSTPLGTAEEVVLAVLRARDEHPRWGPETLHHLLKRRFGDRTPSRRTIARILKRSGRIRARKRRRPPNVVDKAPSVDAQAPNDVWTVDFKGWWRATNGERCEPLTVRDAHSRFVLASTLCAATVEDVRREFERLFRRFGLPAAIQCDNGIPFVSVRSVGGLSSLSAWWVSLGIRLVRSRPGCPQDNGGHERMHSDIAAEVQSHPAPSRGSQQRSLNRWRQQFNHVRPHQVLGGKTPAEVYTPSARRGLRPIRPNYPLHFYLLRVDRNGKVRWRGERYFISESLRGHLVALELIDDLQAHLWFHDLCLNTIELVPHVDDELYTVPRQRRRRSTGHERNPKVDN